MVGCKARADAPPNVGVRTNDEAYLLYAAMRQEERNALRWPSYDMRMSLRDPLAACQRQGPSG